MHSRATGDWRVSWIDHAEVMYDGPLSLHYTGLARDAQYRVRIVYGGERNATRIPRLTADSQYEVHGYRKLDNLTEPVEFPIPREATADGALTLTWQRQPGLSGNGRGNQVAEVWLLRAPAAQ
jgi:hypothetical protein